MITIYDELIVELGDPTKSPAQERAEAAWGCCQVYEGTID